MSRILTLGLVSSLVVLKYDIHCCFCSVLRFLIEHLNFSSLLYISDLIHPYFSSFFFTVSSTTSKPLLHYKSCIFEYPFYHSLIDLHLLHWICLLLLFYIIIQFHQFLLYTKSMTFYCLILFCPLFHPFASLFS